MLKSSYLKCVEENDNSRAQGSTVLGQLSRALATAAMKFENSSATLFFRFKVDGNERRQVRPSWLMDLENVVLLGVKVFNDSLV